MLVARKRRGGFSIGGKTLGTPATPTSTNQTSSFIKDITPLAGVLAKSIADVGMSYFTDRRAGQEAERKRKEDMEATERKKREEAEDMERKRRKKLEDEEEDERKYRLKQKRKADERREEAEYKASLKAAELAHKAALKGNGGSPFGRSTTQFHEQALRDVERLAAQYGASPALLARIATELTGAIEAPADPEDPQYYSKVLSEIGRELSRATLGHPAPPAPPSARQPPGWPTGSRPKGGKTGISPLGGSRSASAKRGRAMLWGGGIATPIFD